MAWRALARMFGVLALCSLAACARSFAPTTPRVARGEGLELELVGMAVSAVDLGSSDLAVELAVEALPGPRWLVQAALADAREARCVGGTRSEHVGRAPLRSDGDALEVGDRLRAHFTRRLWRDAQTIPLRVDVVLEDAVGARTCVTLPLVDAAPSVAFRPRTRYSLGLGFAVQPFQRRVGQLEGLASFPITLGRWFGPMRAFASIAPGVTDCPDSRCALPSGRDAKQKLAVPVALGADVGRSFGVLRLGIAGSYRLLVVRLARGSESDRLVAHGPVIAPRIGLSLPDPIAPGLPGGERIGGFVGFDIPMAVIWDDQGQRGLSLGCGLSFVLPL